MEKAEGRLDVCRGLEKMHSCVGEFIIYIYCKIISLAYAKLESLTCSECVRTQEAIRLPDLEEGLDSEELEKLVEELFRI